MATRKTLPIENLTPAERATWQNPIAANGTLVTTQQHQITPYEEDEEPEETGVDRIAAMLGDVGDDARAYVKVQRVIGPNKYAHCDDYAVASYEEGGLKMIRDTWGPGEYDIRLYGVNRETGRFGVLKSARITISAMLNESVNVPAANRQNTELAQVLQTIAQGQQQMLQALTEKPPAVDPMEMLAKTMALMGTMREAFGLGAAQQAPQAPIKEMLDTMRALKEASKEFGNEGGKSEDDDSPMKMLGPILEIVKASQAQQAHQAAAPVQMPPVALHAPNPVSQPAPAGAQTTEDENVNIETIALLGHLKRIEKLAAAGADPQEGAAILYEKLPDDFIELMASDQWFDLLSQVAPGVTPHREWFTKARDQALAMFAADEAEDSRAEGAPAAPSA